MAKLTTPVQTGWTTFYKVRMPDGHLALVQKNNGSTRTIPASLLGASR